jgi:hypothetical protein
MDLDIFTDKYNLYMRAIKDLNLSNHPSLAFSNPHSLRYVENNQEDF